MSWTLRDLQPDGPLFEGAITVYAEAFARPPYSDPDRGREVKTRIRETHSRRRGFRLVGAIRHEAVVGMTYGYHGEDGQWWHDAVCRAVPPPERRRWFSDSYEVVEVAVMPAFQSLGIGRALVNELLQPRQERTAVLSTRTDSRAHILYGRLGFEVITTLSFATDGHPFYIMGKPLRPE